MDIKELSIEELEQVNGGDFGPGVDDFLIVNQVAIEQGLAKLSPEKKIMLLKILVHIDKTTGIISLGGIKNILDVYNIKGLVDVDYNNPEHLKLLER